MPQKIDLRIPPEQAADESMVKQLLAQKLNVAPNKINSYQILRKSIDARSAKILVNLQVNVFVEEIFEDAFAFSPKLQNVADKKPVIIAGAGPAGLFAALTLIEEGFCPIILERGKDVRNRRRDLADMNKMGIVNPESNYCFGEGGAGTYSDGKLYTRSSKRGNILRALQWFHYFGAVDNILYEAHPHIGTNKLPAIIQNMRQAITDCGGQVLFNSKLTDLILESDAVKAVQVNHSEIIQTDRLILATGHSARDIFELLHQKNILLEAKPFALGVRIEHQQSLIDARQYHCDIHTKRSPYLPPAAYSLVNQSHNRGVFSFCMCPGGIIAPASTNEGELVVNGWSPSKRDGTFANSGMVVTVDEKDFAQYGFLGPLAGMQFQKMVEQKAWQAGGGLLKAPAQRVVDLTNKKMSSSLPDCSYLPGINSAQMHEILPKEIYNSLAHALVQFGKKIKGYFTNDAIVVATESRTSSPVRIPRDLITLQHPQIRGLYPCAEGAGYAGGIISAAMDGDKIASAIAAES